MSDFIFYILNGLFSLIILALILSAILSWLVAFNVVNTRNRGVNMIADILDRITTPILAPFRMFIPPLGGLDLSFFVAFLVIKGMQTYLLPIAYANLKLLIG